jgi:hypothetical protein
LSMGTATVRADVGKGGQGCKSKGARAAARAKGKGAG